MSHSHKQGFLVGALTCLTGCVTPEVSQLTQEQRNEVQEMIDDNTRILPIYAQLIDAVDTDAVFGAGGEETKHAFFVDLQNAHALVKRYHEEGRIYGFDDEEVVGEDKRSWSFHHLSPIEKDQFIAVFIREDHVYYALTGSMLLHEGAHDEMGDHSPEVYEYLNTPQTGVTSQGTQEFGYLLKEKKDFCYLVSTLGTIPEQALAIARIYKSFYTESEWDYRLTSDEETVSEFYARAMADPLMQDQLTWATHVVDEIGFDGSEDVIESLGLDRSELIDILAHETSIYPREHAEFVEQMSEFRREHRREMAEENRETDMPRLYRR